MSKVKPEVQLKYWEITKFGDRTNCLYGDTYGHPNFKDGTGVVTSNIQNITETEDAWIVETRNTIYTCKLEDRRDW